MSLPFPVAVKEMSLLAAEPNGPSEALVLELWTKLAYFREISVRGAFGGVPDSDFGALQIHTQSVFGYILQSNIK